MILFNISVTLNDQTGCKCMRNVHNCTWQISSTLGNTLCCSADAENTDAKEEFSHTLSPCTLIIQ